MKTTLKPFISSILGLSLVLGAFSAFIVPAAAQQSLAVTCSANPTSPYTGQTVTWYAYPTGGNGNYSYTWTGSNALSGNGQSTSLAYYVAGQQNATVIVSSNGQTQTATCYATVGGNNNNNNGNLTATCYANPANGNSITWYVTPMGGNGSYSYSWTGSNGLSGYNQSVTQYYNYSGTQTANVTVSSNGYSYTATCSSYTNNNNNNGGYGQLNAYCYATPSTVNPGQTVTWNGSASGGSGNYTYSWSGSNNLYGYSQIISSTYPSGVAGTQTATLTVNSNGQTAVANCVVNVAGGYYNNGGTYYNGGGYYNGNGQLSSGVYLSSVPYTGAGNNLEIDLFVLGMILWSAFAAYMIIEKKKALNS